MRQINFRLLLLIFFATFFYQSVFAQSQVIKGWVISSKDNQPLVGASIQVLETKSGAQTDEKGGFSISVKVGNHLKISNIGFGDKLVIVSKGQTILQVSVDPVLENLDSVVVVGYAVQKKVNLTGSVSTISAKSIGDRPVTNVTSALAGLSAGVRINQSSGQPGNDGASIQIRGIGTLSSSSVLILVDGIQETSLDAVNPQDIENISILKDASAAIYGSLAANGVILVTTKKGSKNKTVVNFNAMLSNTSPINVPHFVTNYADFMRLVNEGYTNVNQSPIFSAITINAWDSTSKIPNQLNPIGVPNYVAYPNTDWAQTMFQHKLLSSNNISLSGGSDKTRYLMSVNYLQNPGVMDNTGDNRYQIRLNIESKVNKVITVGSQTFASTEYLGKGDVGNAFSYLFQTTPGVYPYYNGKYGFPSAPEESSTANNIQFFLHSSAGKNQTSRFNTTVYANLNLLKGLVFETKANYQTWFNEQATSPTPADRYDFNTMTIRLPISALSTAAVSQSMSKDYAIVLDNVLRYNTNINKLHDIGLLAGYNERYYNYYTFYASKVGMTDYSISDFNSVTTPQTTSGSQTDFSNRSWFGRVNYAFNNKYLLEGNLRYDGVSRFGPTSRWGLFPSVSAAWKITDEKFMKKSSSWLSSLKLRASYGVLGNNASGNYDWQSVYGASGYSYNNVQYPGLAQTRISNPDLKWETTYVTNFGIDGTLFKNKISFIIDAYNRYTNGILTTVPIPLTVGTATAPVINAAAVQTRGIELSLGYHGHLNDIQFNFNGNIAYNTNIVETYKGPLIEGYTTDANGNKIYVSNLGQVSSGGSTRIIEGHSINEYYVLDVYKGNGTYTNTDGTVNINGGPKDGMIRTPNDLTWAQSMIAAGYKLLPGSTVTKSTIWYGDIVYADKNGDGSYGNSYDSHFTGKSSTPKYIYGFTADISWKGFDLYMIWSGAAGMEYYWDGWGYNNNNVRNGFALSKMSVDNRYFYNDLNPSDPKNNINGTALRLRSSDPQDHAASTFWMYNGSYIKLKNLQIGYNLPAKLIQKALITKARIFASGENLFTITKFPGLDPEMGGNVNYPTMRQLSVGLNVTF